MPQKYGRKRRRPAAGLVRAGPRIFTAPTPLPLPPRLLMPFTASEFDLLMMRRALDLARLGTGYARPNPLVGCVITHEGRIIGEGWHRQYGGPHAEVNAIDSRRGAGAAAPQPRVRDAGALRPPRQNAALRRPAH